MFSLEIYIPKSGSRLYSEVIRYAKRTGHYDDATQTLLFTAITQVWQWWENFSFVVWTAQKWIGFMVTANGRFVLPYNNNFYYDLQNIKNCYQSISNSQYYNNCSHDCFGCHQLTTVLKYVQPGISPYQLFYKYGHFENSKTWIIDKRLIADQLIFESRQNFAYNCPMFAESRIVEFVNDLPDKIEINNFWSVEYKTIIGKNGLDRIPSSINYNFEPQPVNEDDDIKPMHRTKKPDNDSSINDINDFLDELLKKKKPE